MGKIPSLTMLVCVAACSYPDSRWDKEGADEKTTANDLVACSRAAQQESFRIYPDGFGVPFFGATRFNRFENDRVYSESRLTDFCMRNKGYTLVMATPPKDSPPSAPSQTTPATEK